MTEPAGVILAGGLATRMGGGDKCLLPLGGAPMLEGIIARLKPQVSALALNANGDAARLARFGLPVVADSVEGFAGPLAGVLAGLDWAAEQGIESIVTAAGIRPFFHRILWCGFLRPLRAWSIRSHLRRRLTDGSQPLGFGLWRCVMICAQHLRAGCARS